jgi:hypothetical protein
MSKEDIKIIFEKTKSNFFNDAQCLAQICFEYNIKPCCIQKSGIDFQERSFWKKHRTLRKCDGDGEAVSLIIFVLNFFHHFKKK